MKTEAEILSELKSLAKEGREKLAEIRRIKKESRPPKSPSLKMSQFIKARKSVDPETELFMLNRLLDRDDLTRSERNSLKVRRKSVMERLNNPVG